MKQKQYNKLIDSDSENQSRGNILVQKKLENTYYHFDDLKKKWTDKCYDQDCIYGDKHQSVKAISVKFNDIKIREDINHLSAYATKEVVIDKNVMIEGGHITVIAPSIKVPYDVSIDLSGKHGQSYENTKAESGTWIAGSLYNNVGTTVFSVGTGIGGVLLGMNVSIFGGAALGAFGPVVSLLYPVFGSPESKKGGTDGSHGISGSSGTGGGSITMIAQKYYGLEHLKINVNGGNGGSGQNGGDGGSCSTNYITAPTKRAGGDGGNGGNSGHGGKKGVVQIYQQKQNIKQLYIDNISEIDGKDGSVGIGGKGGNGWVGKIYKSGNSGCFGSTGELKSVSEGENSEIIPKNTYNFGYLPVDKIKYDYTDFMNNCASDAFKNPVDYSDIVGKGTDFTSFL